MRRAPLRMRQAPAAHVTGPRAPAGTLSNRAIRGKCGVRHERGSARVAWHEGCTELETLPTSKGIPHMMRALLLAFTALPLVACSAAVDDSEETAAAMTEQELRIVDGWVDFDQVFAAPAFPTFGSTPVPAGAIVDTSYAGYGVTFSCVVCSSGHAYARPISSGSNGVTLVDPATSVLPFFDARNGAVKAEFATARSWVSIDARPVLPPEFVGVPVGMPWLEAYDASGNLLMKTLYPFTFGQAGWGSAQTLVVSAPSASIKYVRFSSRYVANTPPVYGEFDNLRFNGDPLVRVPIEKPPIFRLVLVP